jgi:hypothetical protein
LAGGAPVNHDKELRLRWIGGWVVMLPGKRVRDHMSHIEERKMVD